MNGFDISYHRDPSATIGFPDYLVDLGVDCSDRYCGFSGWCANQGVLFSGLSCICPEGKVGRDCYSGKFRVLFYSDKLFVCCPMFLNTGSGGIDISKVKLTFEMLTMRSQQHSFPINAAVILRSRMVLMTPNSATNK